MDRRRVLSPLHRRPSLLRRTVAHQRRTSALMTALAIVIARRAALSSSLRSFDLGAVSFMSRILYQPRFGPHSSLATTLNVCEGGSRSRISSIPSRSGSRMLRQQFGSRRFRYTSASKRLELCLPCSTSIQSVLMSSRSSCQRAS